MAWREWRFWLLCGLLFILPAVLLWHLSRLQVVPGQEKGHDFLQAAGKARTFREEKLPAYRGAITDRNGELLAVSTPVISVAVNPRVISKAGLDRLARLLELDAPALHQKMARFKNKQFMYVARQLPPHVADTLKASKIKGLILKQDYQRYYPAGEVTAHVVGFTNVDDRGQEGMELALDEHLAGEPGIRSVIKDLKGNLVKDLGIKRPASSGENLSLSIDLRLQYLAYRELKSAIAKQKAVSGSIVMIDVKTGEVLAMVNQPSYNPNDRDHLKPDQMRNRAITDLIEPGSTVKPFTVMAALESGRYKPSTVIDTHPGFIRVATKTFVDFRNYGVIDLATAIQKSSQVAISKIALDLPAQAVPEMYQRLGFGQSTGSGFPGESAGVLPHKSRWHPIERATLAFGYGLSVTPLQLAQSYVTVVKAEIADQVAVMLKRVTEQGGTATRAQTSAYLTAGKTGTAHKASKTGYEDDKYIATFAGIAPANDPKIVTVVVINEPSTGHYFGGEAAAPIFASVVDSSLRLLNIPPNNSLQAVPAKQVAKR
jgi:cell division protein FtsI (penicillin-binding protein 3)